MSKNKLKLKVGDEVVVISGKDRGKTGAITQVFSEQHKVVVDGVNKMYRHLRSQQQGQEGQRVEFFGPIHISNVMLVDPEKKTRTRVGYSVIEGEDGKTQKVRVAKKSNATL